MADDTVQNATDTIATDHVTTLNGAASTVPKVQRVKVTFGDDGTARDASLAFPLPIMLPDVSTSGTITATDAVLGVHGGAGVLLTGTPTTASFVALALPGGEAAFVVQLTGTFGAGTVWFECSADSTTGTNGNWTTLSLRTIGTTGTTISDSSTAAGLFRGTASGMTYVRARITGATTPSVAVVLRASDAPGPVGLNAPLPTGTNTIGAITGTGAAGTPAAGVQTVQGIAGATAVPVSGAFFQATQPVSLASAPTTPVTGTFWQATQPVSIAAAVVNAAGTNAIGHINELRASTLAATITAATGVAATLTLPAAGASLFHYITGIEMTLYSTAARTGVAAPIVVTTTNLPGSLAYTFDTAGAIGTNVTQRPVAATPVKSSVANTATTIVAPIVTGGIWRISATYFTAV